MTQAPLWRNDPARHAEQVSCARVDAEVKLSIDPAVHLAGRAARIAESVPARLARERENVPSHSPFTLSKTHPAFASTTLVKLKKTPDGLQTPVLAPTPTHSPSSNPFGARHVKHPPLPPLQHVSHSALHATQLSVVESKKVRAAQATNVPFESWEEAVVHFVASVARGWSEVWQVRQVPVGLVQVAQEGSQAGKELGYAVRGRASERLT